MSSKTKIATCKSLTKPTWSCRITRASRSTPSYCLDQFLTGNKNMQKSQKPFFASRHDQSRLWYIFTVVLIDHGTFQKMSSEMMVYSCSPWKTGLDSTLLPLSFLNNCRFLTMEISRIIVTLSFRFVALTGRRVWCDSSESVLLVIYMQR